MIKCQYCGGVRKSKASKVQHELYCEFNPNKRIQHRGKTGKRGGNQFTTGRCTTHSAESKKILSEKATGKKHSEETKEKISKIRKQFLETHPEKIPYLLNHSSKISYPEQYFIECFSENKQIIFQHNVFRYKLDFANIEKKKYLEIDGEQHYVDKNIVEHDKKRTEKLEELGWNGIRIRWKEFIKLTREQKEIEITRVIEYLS